MRVIDAAGEMLGVMTTAEALRLAREKEVDLVEVSPVANPPVCKIIDFGQLKYEANKKERKQRVKQKKTEVKGIRLSTTIGDHDLGVRAKQAKKFLEEGNKVQIELLLRGRQKAHPEIGRDVVLKFMELLLDVAVIESTISLQGGKVSAILMPKK